MNNMANKDMICKEINNPEKIKLVHKRSEVYDVIKASKCYESSDFRAVIVSGDEVSQEIGERCSEIAEHSDSIGSDSECDSDISTPTSENGVGFGRSRQQHGSYDFVFAQESNECDDDVGTDTEGEFVSDEGSTSLSGSDSESYNNIDGDKMDTNGDVIRHLTNRSTSDKFQDGDDNDSYTLQYVRRGDNPEDALRESRHSSQSSLFNDNKKGRTASYQRACSRESNDVSDDEHFAVDYAEFDNGDYDESLQYNEQLTSLEDSAGINEESDPHGLLIRKPAVRRKGFAWVSKSLPRTSRKARIKQERKQNFESSPDLGPSLLTLYDHRIASRNSHADGDYGEDDFDDDMVADDREESKTKSLPAGYKKNQIDGEQYYGERPPFHRLSRDVYEMSNETIVPMVHAALDDTKKRPLSVTSSNSLTYSPRMRKKRANEDTGDGDEILPQDLQNFNRTVEADSKLEASTCESRISVDNGYQKPGNGDRHLDNMSIASSEIDGFGHDTDLNINEDCSRTSPASSGPNVSQPGKPSDGSNLKLSSNDPNFNYYDNSGTRIPFALGDQSKMFSSSSEDGHSLRDPQSPTLRTSTEADTKQKSDISRHSSSSLSRHEARMKFFTNYEEIMTQSPTPQLPEAEKNHISSASSPATSSSSGLSTLAPSLTAETSGTAVNTQPTQATTASSTPSIKISSEIDRDKFPRILRSSERTSRRSDRRNSSSKHEGLSASSRSGFSRSSKKRDLTSSSDARSSQGYISYVSRVVTEIIESERMYIASLEDIINGYLEPMEKILTSNYAKDIECLFSNIRDIYKFGCIFLADLERASSDCVKVAQCFVRHNMGFVIYTDYCTNYPRAVEVLTRFMQHPELSELCKERQQALGHGLPLGAYLLKPVQRILKYHLLLHNILKNCEKDKEDAKILEQALHHMTEMAHHINEMKRKHEHAVRIQEIQSQLEDYVGEDLTRLGELALEGTFKVYGAKASRQVFLFERGLLICKKSEGSMLSCKAFVLCSNLMLVEVIPNEPLSFHIIPFNNPRAQYTLQARNMEQKRQWCQNIKGLILESYKGRIPDNVKSLIMQLGREHDDDYVSKEAMEAGRKNQHTAPEYLEKRKFRGKSGSRIPDFSLLRPQKAKRGGNKKGDVRSGEKSPETNRRAKSKSPEGHRQMLSRQNAAKARSLSSNSPAMPVAAFCQSLPHSFQVTTKTDVKNAEPTSPDVPECTSPESPVYRKSKLMHFKNGDEEKTTEVIKRPLSFLMARANPILSADLTQLLAKCGGSIKMQTSSQSDGGENDKILLTHTINGFSESNLNNTSDLENDLFNEQQHTAEEENMTEDSKYNNTVANLSERDHANANNSSETKSDILEDNYVSVQSSLNQEDSKDTDTKSTISLTLEMLKKAANNSCECEASTEENKSISVSAENNYENINISKDNSSDEHSDHQCFMRIERTRDNNEHDIETLENEGKTLINHDILNKTVAENELKQKSLRLPNTSKHLLTHDYRLTDGVKAKLTDWNSVDKLTKGSMSDLPHPDDDPWVRNSEVTSSDINMDAESLRSSRLSTPTTSRTQGNSDASEMMQISNNKENLDWLVYLNRNSSTSQKYQSSDELRMSTPTVNKYSSVHQHLETKSKPSSQISSATSPRENMTFENMIKLGLIKDNNKDESFYQNKLGKNTSLSSPKKINAFGVFPKTTTMAKSASFFTSTGLFRSNSTPISKIKDHPVAKVAFKERPVSLDIDRLTGQGNKTITKMKEYMRNSSENLEDANTLHANLPIIKVKDEEADSNRLSLISSVSTSSYESQSGSSSDGLVSTSKSKLHTWSKTSNSRPESDISCASTLTSDDEDKDMQPPHSGNTFEPPSKNRSSWKEDRQLETVLREHSLGSSKLGSRMAQSITQPAEQVITHCSESYDHESHPQSFYESAALNRKSEQFDELSTKGTNYPIQVKPSLNTAETTETFAPFSMTNFNISQSASGFSNHNKESNMMSFVPPTQEMALELSEELSKEATPLDNLIMVKATTTRERSNTEHSSESESADTFYERKLSAAFDSDIFQEIPEVEKHIDKDLKEAMLLKKSIREYVKDFEEKFKAQSPKIFEVKRREPGVMIRQRLQTLRESALHGWRNISTSSSKPPWEERTSQLSYNDRKALTVKKDNSFDSKNKSVCLRPSSSRDSLSKSVDNLSRSRDDVFISRSRDSLNSVTRSKDNLNSMSESPGCRHSAPVFLVKPKNPGHEKDGNRFRYRAPEEGQTILGNQFLYKRSRSSSEHSLLDSELHSSLDKGIGSVQSSRLMHQQSENNSETNNLVVMKGWVKSLISKFQVH